MKEVPRAPPDPEPIQALEIRTHYLVADDPLGPFCFSTHDFLIGDPVGSLYSGKLIDGPDGRPNFLAWRNITPDGVFVGELADPFQVAVDGEGNLAVLRTLAGEQLFMAFFQESCSGTDEQSRYQAGYAGTYCLYCRSSMNHSLFWCKS